METVAGIWGALPNVYPEAVEQRCGNHRILNVLDSKGRHAQAKLVLCHIPYAETRKETDWLGAQYVVGLRIQTAEEVAA